MENELQGAGFNAAKILLADEATSMLHGSACLQEIHKTAASLFAGTRSGSQDVESLQKIELTAADFSLPVHHASSMEDSSPNTAAVAGPVIYVYDLLLKAEFASSKSEARRLIKQGGAKVNDVKVAAELATVSTADFDSANSKRLKLSAGKKKHVIFVLT